MWIIIGPEMVLVLIVLIVWIIQKLLILAGIVIAAGVAMSILLSLLFTTYSGYCILQKDILERRVSYIKLLISTMVLGVGLLYFWAGIIGIFTSSSGMWWWYAEEVHYGWLTVTLVCIIPVAFGISCALLNPIRTYKLLSYKLKRVP